MGLLDVHAEGIDADIQRQLRNPGPPPPERDFSVLSFFGAAGRGIPTAGLESMGTVADLITKDTSRNAPGTVLRRKANEFAPPEAAHTADKVIHGLTRFGTKVAVDVGTMGPVAGAVALAIDEGNTTTQNLRTQGVDTATAAKVGAVTGVVSGVGAVLPIAGPTVKATLGLIAAGGPVSYVAQEAAAREILQRAGYGEEAAKHDPTDPLGLALSVAIPGFVGGIHIRNLRKSAASSPPQPTLADVVQSMESGGRRYGKDGALLTSPKGAQGEMQVMPGTARDPGFGVTPARDGSPDELARVGREYLAAMERRYNDPAQAMAAYNAGPGAVDAAKAKHGAAWLDHMPKETRDYVAKGLRKLGDVAPKEDAAITAAARTPEAQDAARVRVTTDALARSLPDNPAAHGEVMRAADMVAAGESVDVLPLAEIPDIRPPALSDWMSQNELAPTTAMDTPVARGNTFVSWVKSQGGISYDNKVDIVGERGIRGNYAGMFTRDGQNLDTLVESAVQAGYLTRADVDSANDNGGTRALAELVRRATTGERIQRIEDVQAAQAAKLRARADADAVDFMERELQALGVDTSAARGDADILGNYLSTHRDALVNKRLAEIDAETASERVQTGEAYDLNPQQIDQQSRIALASEINPRAVQLAAEKAVDEVDFLNRIEDILGNEPRSQKAVRREPSIAPEPRFSAGDEARPGEPANAGGSATATDAPAVPAATLARLTEEMPDMPVRLPGSDKTTTLAQALEMAKKEAEFEAGEADLVKAAFECALSFGA
jgi:hypothetical protein